MQPETVQEEQKDDPNAAAMDDESAATEMADGNAPDGQPSDEEWKAIIDTLWVEYDQDNSGFLDKDEMAPLAQAALNQIGYSETLDKGVCDAFFVEVDSDGNG